MDVVLLPGRTVAVLPALQQRWCSPRWCSWRTGWYASRRSVKTASACDLKSLEYDCTAVLLPVNVDTCSAQWKVQGGSPEGTLAWVRQKGCFGAEDKVVLASAGREAYAGGRFRWSRSAPLRFSTECRGREHKQPNRTHLCEAMFFFSSVGTRAWARGTDLQIHRDTVT